MCILYVSDILVYRLTVDVYIKELIYLACSCVKWELNTAELFGKYISFWSATNKNPLIFVAAESLTLPAEGLKARIEVKNVECMHFTIILTIDKTALILIQIYDMHWVQSINFVKDLYSLMFTSILALSLPD